MIMAALYAAAISVWNHSRPKGSGLPEECVWVGGAPRVSFWPGTEYSLTPGDLTCVATLLLQRRESLLQHRSSPPFPHCSTVKRLFRDKMSGPRNTQDGGFSIAQEAEKIRSLFGGPIPLFSSRVVVTKLAPRSKVSVASPAPRSSIDANMCQIQPEHSLLMMLLTRARAPAKQAS